MSDSPAPSRPGDVIPILGKMGIEVVEAAPGRAVATIPAEPNGNHFGVMYAGSLFSVAECLGGVVALASFDTSGGLLPIVKSMQIDFLKPALGEIRAEVSLSPEEMTRIQTEADETGRSQYVLTANLTDANGMVVARTEGTYQLRRL